MANARNAWAWHMLDNGDVNCASFVYELLAGKAPATHLGTTDALIDALSGEGVGFTVCDVAANHVYTQEYNATAQDRHMVFCHDDHVSVGVLAKPDHVSGFYPPEVTDTRFDVHADLDLSSHDNPEQWHDWRTLYIAKNHGDLRPEIWSPWEDISSRLDEHFGDKYVHHAVGFSEEQRSDKRLAQLAGWSSYHRTNVLVIYKDAGCFRINPDYDAPAHENARPGRAVVIQLGEHGARHWWSPEPGDRAYNSVYCPAALSFQRYGGVNDVTLPKIPVSTDRRARKARMGATYIAISYFKNLQDDALNAAYFASRRRKKNGRWPEYDPPEHLEHRLSELASLRQSEKAKIRCAAYGLIAWYASKRPGKIAPRSTYAKVLVALR